MDDEEEVKDSNTPKIEVAERIDMKFAGGGRRTNKTNHNQVQLVIPAAKQNSVLNIKSYWSMDKKPSSNVSATNSSQINRNEVQENIKNLKIQLDGSKRFLNMVIHDMRNPTTSIKMGLENTCNTLHQLEQIN
jgi:hypothetical protein